MMRRNFAVFIVILSIRCVGHAQERPCTVPESEIAMKEALGPPFQAWDALYKSYKLHGNCDDGIMAENYGESVARILVDHWSTLPRLASLARKNTDFRHFVLKHVDATLDMKDIEKIRTKAERQCPKGLHTLCDDLRKQATSALKEDASSP
jgi:hypothetical protein